MSAVRLGLVPVLCLFVVGCGGGDQAGKRDAARRIAKKLAFEAYPQWAIKPSNHGCPAVEDLAEFANQKPDFKDPWGEPYVIKCGADVPAGAGGVAVLSKGADRKEGTSDDVRSWEQP